MSTQGAGTVSSRGRGPEWDEDEWEDERPRRRRPAPPPARTFGLPIVAAALLVGLIIGFIASCGGGGTKTVTATRTVTAPASTGGAGAAVVPSGPASRGTITVAFLNGSGEAGLAATKADVARGLGYQNVTVGDAPSSVSADAVVYRKGSAARAAQVAQDLGLGTPTQLTAGDAILTQAAGANVIVLLGPSANSSIGTGTAPSGSGTAPAATGTTPTG